MKELYSAPQLELVSLEPVERLADATIPYDDMDDREYTNPLSFIYGGKEIEMPIR